MSKKESKKAGGATEAARALFSGSKKKKKSDADKTRTRDLLNTQNKGKRLLLGTYVYNGKILPGIDDHLLQCSVVEVNPDCKTCTLKFDELVVSVDGMLQKTCRRGPDKNVCVLTLPTIWGGGAPQTEMSQDKSSTDFFCMLTSNSLWQHWMRSTQTEISARLDELERLEVDVEQSKTDFK